MVAAGGGEHEGVDAALQEARDDALLALGDVVEARGEHRAAGGGGDVFDGAADGSAERFGDVSDDETDGAGAAVAALEGARVEVGAVVELGGGAHDAGGGFARHLRLAV